MFVVFEVGSLLCFVIFFFVLFFIWFVYNVVFEVVGIKMFIFIVFVGLKVLVIEFVVCGVFFKFYFEDMYFVFYCVFIFCGKCYVVIVNFRIMVELFFKEYLDVEVVMGIEL